MSESKKYDFQIVVTDYSGNELCTHTFGDDIVTLKAEVPKVIADLCKKNRVVGRIGVTIEISDDNGYLDSDEIDLYIEDGSVSTIEPCLYRIGANYKCSGIYISITPEKLKNAMRIRSAVISGYPNPCAYTDRYQEEYNILALYLAKHYPKDKEISMYSPVFNNICTWELAVKDCTIDTVLRFIANDKEMTESYGAEDMDKLRAFYYGRLDTAGEKGPLWESISAAEAELIRDKEEIISLFPNVKGLIDRYTEKNTELCSMRLYNEFAKGFRLGMQITLEGMKKEGNE